MKKIACLTILVLLMMQISPAVLAASAPSSWALAEVNEARGKGLVIADADDNFQDYITRELFCKLVVNMVEENLGGPVTVTIANPFTDATNEAVVKAYQLGIVNGVSATLFAPTNLITRQEVAVMMMRASRKLDQLQGTGFATGVNVAGINFDDGTEIASWAMDDVKQANRLGIMNGVGGNRINPLGNTTIEQSILLSLRLFNEMEALSSPTVVVPEINAVPLPLSDPVTFAINEGMSYTYTGTDLASDLDGDPLEIIGVSGVFTYGTPSVSGGQLSFTSTDIAADVVQTIIVTVSDGASSVDVNVSLEINAEITVVNTPPKPLDTEVIIVVREGEDRTVTPSELAVVDSGGLDVDGQRITIKNAVLTGSTVGQYTYDQAGGQYFRYQSTDILDSDVIEDRFLITLTDGEDDTSMILVMRVAGDAKKDIVQGTELTFEVTKGEELILKVYDLFDGAYVSDIIKIEPHSNMGMIALADIGDLEIIPYPSIKNPLPGQPDIPVPGETLKFTATSKTLLMNSSNSYDVTITNGAYIRTFTFKFTMKAQKMILIP